MFLNSLKPYSTNQAVVTLLRFAYKARSLHLEFLADYLTLYTHLTDTCPVLVLVLL